MFKKYVFDSKIKGKNILVLGGVHGNEVAGTKAQNILMEKIKNNELNLKSGLITFIPVVNKEAQRQDKRFVDVNLNRVVCFHENAKLNEEKIANELIKEIEKCDVMIDLHSTHCKGDEAFAFMDYPNEGNKDLLSLIPVRYALAGWPNVYEQSEEIENFCTEKYANICGKVGITVECGYHKSTDSVDVALTSLLNVFAYYGLIDKRHEIYNSEIINMSSFFVKKAEGKMTKEYKHLTKIKKGEVLAIYNNGEQIVSQFDGYIIIPNHECDIGEEWFYTGS